MKTILAGPVYSAGPGQEIDVPVKVAKQLIDGGFAVKVEIETAAIEPPEKAIVEKPKPRTQKRGNKK